MFTPQRWITASELKLGLRLMRRQPVATLTALLALSVGIGMATTGFTLLDSVLHARLPFANGDRFVLVNVYAEPAASRTTLGQARFRFLAEHASTLEYLGAVRSQELNLLLPSGESVPVRSAFISPDSFRVLPGAPLLGRTLEPGDGRHGAAPVVLLREGLWRRHLSADPAALGRTAMIGGQARTIVGVLPDDFQFPNSEEAWLPLGESPTGADAAAWSTARAFGVLPPGARPPAAEAQLAALSSQFEAAQPGSPALRLTVLPFGEALSQGMDLLAGVFVACLVLVLLVIAANIANLVLARTFARSGELAVRAALGATRPRLVGQIAAEVLMMGLVAAGLGLTASQGALAWMRAILSDMPFWVDFTASPRTMLFAAVAALLVAAIGGVLPALRATRPDAASAMASSGRGVATGFGLLGGTMVALQVALSVALLNGALVIARGVSGYMTPRIGVPAGEILTARIGVEGLAPDTPQALLRAIRQMPGVRAATAGSYLPGLSPPVRMIAVETALREPAAAPRAAPVAAVEEGFFETFGGRASQGRVFVASDFADRVAPVVVVNEPFVARFFAGRDPVGRRIRIVPPDNGAAAEPWREIVGVVPDLGLSAGDEEMAAGLYLPMGVEPFFYVALRTGGDARLVSARLRAAITRVHPDIVVREVLPLAEVTREDRAVFAGIGGAMAALGGMALLLTVIGTYAMLSLAVTRRTREIGIRTALGAPPARILQSVMGTACLPLVVGTLGGAALGALLVQARVIFAFRLPAGSGPWGPLAIGAVLIAAGCLAAWVPVRRALAVAPAEALRSE